MLRQEFFGSEASELKLERLAPTSYKKIFEATCPPAIKLRGSCGPGSVELGPAWPAAASTNSHRPGSGWAEEEGWQEGQEQLGKGRV